MDLKLKGKRALVCGSSKGIGRACAEELARLGCRVTLLARNEQLLAEVSTSFPEGALGGVIAVDVNDKEALGRAIESDLKEHGAFHILVNNSGGAPWWFDSPRKGSRVSKRDGHSSFYQRPIEPVDHSRNGG